jgi:hypothetical protein
MPGRAHAATPIPAARSERRTQPRGVRLAATAHAATAPTSHQPAGIHPSSGRMITTDAATATTAHAGPPIASTRAATRTARPGALHGTARTGRTSKPMAGAGPGGRLGPQPSR